MSRLVIQSTREGLHVSADSLEQSGAEPGELFAVLPLPSRKTIQSRALRYLTWNFGDALGAGDPAWDGQEWAVSIVGPGGSPALGTLYLDENGEVLEDRLPTREDLLEKLDAADPQSSAA